MLPNYGIYIEDLKQSYGLAHSTGTDKLVRSLYNMGCCCRFGQYSSCDFIVQDQFLREEAKEGYKTQLAHGYIGRRATKQWDDEYGDG